MLLATAWLARLSVAFSAIVSAAVLPSVSLNVPSAEFTCVNDPVIVSVVPAFDTLAPPALLAESTPFVSLATTVKLSPAVVPLSATLTPGTAPALPTPSPSVDGAVITGTPFTVTATVAGLAVLPNPSLPASEIVSDPAVASLSVRLASAAPTWLNVPLITRLVVFAPLIVAPPAVAAESSPFVSETVTVAASFVVLPLSDRLMLPIAAAVPTPITVDVGAENTGRPFTVTAIVFCAPVLPNVTGLGRTIACPNTTLPAALALDCRNRVAVGPRALAVSNWTRPRLSRTWPTTRAELLPDSSISDVESPPYGVSSWRTALAFPPERAPDRFSVPPAAPWARWTA